MHLCVGTGVVNTVSPRHNLSSYLTVHEQRCRCIREGGKEGSVEWRGREGRENGGRLGRRQRSCTGTCTCRYTMYMYMYMYKHMNMYTCTCTM